MGRSGFNGADDDDDTAGGRDSGGGDGVRCGVWLGNGGRKSGICGGGFQPEVLGLFRGGVEGLDIGERGSVGVSGRGLDIRSFFRSSSTWVGSSSELATSTFICCEPEGGLAGRASSSLSVSSSSETSSSMGMFSGTGMYTRCIASSRSSRRPTASAATTTCRWHKRDCTTTGLTSELIEILEPPRGVHRVSCHLFALGRTVLVQLFYPHSQLFQCTRSVLRRKAQSSSMFGVLGACACKDLQIPREEVGQDACRLGRSFRKVIRM